MSVPRPQPLSRRACLGLLGAAPCLAQIPYKARPKSPVAYDSPSREGASQPRPAEILLGYFGPPDPAHLWGGTAWMGAALAVEDANAAGGSDGSPFRLLPRWSDDAWRAGASSIVKLVYEEPVSALIGGIDSATTHLVAQIAAKALLPIVDPISTDETVNHAGVPWVFSWAPGNREIARKMREALSPEPFLLVAGTDHDSRMLAEVFLKAGGRHPALRIDTSGLGHPGVPREADQVVVIAPPACTIACSKAFPPRTKIVAGPSASSRACASLSGRLQTPTLACLDQSLMLRLEQRFAQSSDVFAQLSYRATENLLGVIQRVGAERAGIREALAGEMPPGGRRAGAPPCQNPNMQPQQGDSE
ncbi:MAG: ABC transporter substrate-binding protein [Bryobacterales bacterium]|nr:ABC transporter substrate-binding protein [Bryobacterales bacterium]